MKYADATQRKNLLVETFSFLSGAFGTVLEPPFRFLGELDCDTDLSVVSHGRGESGF